MGGMHDGPADEPTPVLGKTEQRGQQDLINAIVKIAEDNWASPQTIMRWKNGMYRNEAAKIEACLRSREECYREPLLVEAEAMYWVRMSETLVDTTFVELDVDAPYISEDQTRCRVIVYGTRRLEYVTEGPRAGQAFDRPSDMPVKKIVRQGI